MYICNSQFAKHQFGIQISYFLNKIWARNLVETILKIETNSLFFIFIFIFSLLFF